MTLVEKSVHGPRRLKSWRDNAADISMTHQSICYTICSQKHAKIYTHSERWITRLTGRWRAPQAALLNATCRIIEHQTLECTLRQWDVRILLPRLFEGCTWIDSLLFAFSKHKREGQALVWLWLMLVTVNCTSLSPTLSYYEIASFFSQKVYVF